jgi:hypothetical protein
MDAIPVGCLRQTTPGLVFQVGGDKANRDQTLDQEE